MLSEFASLQVSLEDSETNDPHRSNRRCRHVPIRWAASIASKLIEGQRDVPHYLLCFQRRFAEVEMFSIGGIRDCAEAEHAAESPSPERAISRIWASKSGRCTLRQDRLMLGSNPRGQRIL